MINLFMPDGGTGRQFLPGDPPAFMARVHEFEQHQQQVEADADGDRGRWHHGRANQQRRGCGVFGRSDPVAVGERPGV